MDHKRAQSLGNQGRDAPPTHSPTPPTHPHPQKRRILHIRVLACFTYHTHISMPVAQGSSRILIDSLAPVRKLHTRGGAVGTLHPSGSNRISGVLHPVKVTGVSPVYFA